MSYPALGQHQHIADLDVLHEEFTIQHIPQLHDDSVVRGSEGILRELHPESVQRLLRENQVDLISRVSIHTYK